jgi:hypothetical protein
MPIFSRIAASEPLLRLGICLLLLGASGAIGASESAFAVPWPEAPADDRSVVPWGRPLQDGPIDVLAVVPVFGQTDLAELAARLDLNVTVLPVWGREIWAREGDEQGLGGVQERLGEALSGRHDLLLFANVVLDSLDAARVDQVRERVEGGAGLLLITAAPAPGTPFENLLGAAVRDDAATAELRALAASLDRAPALLEAYTLGAGRVCRLTWGPPPACQAVLPCVHDEAFVTLEARESDYALIAECAMWAARRQGAQRILSVTIPGWQSPVTEDLPPDLSQEEMDTMLAAVFAPPTQTVHVELAQPTAAHDILRLGIRAPEHKTRTTYDSEAVPRDTRVVALEVPALPRSGYVDAWLEERGAVVDWYTAPFSSPGPPPLTLSLQQEAVPAHVGLGVTVEKRGVAVQGAPAAALRVTDAWGRVVAQDIATWPAEGTVLQGELSLYDLLAPQVTVEAFILPAATRDPQVWTLLSVPQASQRVAVRAPRREQGFMMAARGLSTAEYVPRQHHELLRRYGLQTLLVEPSEYDLAYVADAGLVPVLEITPDYLAATGNGEQNDPLACVEDCRDALTRVLGSASTFGPVSAVVALNSEGSPSLEALRGDSAWLHAFRDYLRVAYVSLDALNAAWGGGFASWDEAAPPAFEFEGAGGASFAPWLDTRMFLRQRELEAAVAVRALVTDVDAEGLSGIATDSPIPAGFDVATAAASLDLFFLPPDLGAIACFGSSAGPNAAGLIAFPGTRNDADPKWLCWYAAVNGVAGVWMPHPYATVAPEAMPFAVSAGGLATSELVSLSDAVQHMRDGFGEVYRRATAASPRVALYVSPASAVLDELNPAFGGDTASLDVWIESLHSLRLPFEVISSRQAVERGLEGYEAVVLPCARALSAAECARLAAFHAGGGVLIASLLPGQFDEHGVLRQESPLAALFNVTQGGPPIPVDVEDARVRFNAEGELVNVGAVTADASLAPRDAEVLEEGPSLWLTTQDKSGATLLLNHSVSRDQADTLQRGIGAFMERIGRDAGLRSVEIDAGPGVWAWQHTFGAARLLTLLRHPDSKERAERVRVEFGEKANLYTPADGVMLSRGDSATVRLQAGEPSVLVQLPYKVKGLKLSVPEEVKLGDRLNYAVEIETEEALPGDHLVHVTVGPLNGEVLDAYSHTLLCSAGKGGGFIPLALNDAEAFYRVVARDVITGMSAEATVKALPHEAFSSSD